jgi:hypothetical protein
MSTENNKDIQWTEDTIAEWAEFYRTRQGTDAYWGVDLMKAFKESKREKRSPEYEILSFRDPCSDAQHRIVAYQSPHLTREDWAKSWLRANAPIHSVRRLSDGEVFSVGDTVYHVDGLYPVTITEFYQPPSDRGEMWFYWSSFKETVKNLDNFKKQDSLISPPKKPLFTTEDGVDTYEDQDCWVVRQGVSGGWNLHNWAKVHKEGMKDGEKYFHFYKNAEAWIAAQKPPVLFTTEDGVEITDRETPLYMVLAKATWQTGETTTDRHLRRAVTGSSAWKYFAIEYNRDRYILMNKPLLSINEVMETHKDDDRFETFLSAITSLAKAKL